MKQYSKLLKQQESHHAPIVLRKHGLICKQVSFGSGPAPLYLAKPNWTNRFDQERDTTIGIFCSIWVSPALLGQKQFAYNIHSKAIRTLPGYKLTSQKFASDFRSLVKTDVSKWPGIRLDYGPTTLLEGREVCELNSFAEKIEERMHGFVDIHLHIDNLLEASLL
ncbi:MAG: hypothetical protein V3U65_12490 [Granulosicoccaceae bacterium]